MKIWLPYVETGSGTDAFTRSIETALKQRGHGVEVTAFDHRWQYFPWRLRLAPTPSNTDLILANSWNAFAFSGSGSRLVSVVHLLVLDKALSPYRSFAQSVFHNTLVRQFEHLSAVHADATVTVSRYTAQQLTKRLGLKDPVVILNGVDTNFFRPSTSLPTDRFGRPMQLLFVGTMSRRKGADLLPRIMERLGDDYELRFTGEPGGSLPSRPSLKPLGRLDRDEVRTAYQEADLLLFPSRLEGLPLVALEAMACGTPVVASNTGSLPEIINDGVNGRLCPVDDIEGFTEAIRQLRNSPASLMEMGEAARQMVESAFSLERMGDEYIALFRRLTNSTVR